MDQQAPIVPGHAQALVDATRKAVQARVHEALGPYRTRDIRYDLAWAAALRLGQMIQAGQTGPGRAELAEHIRQCLHPASVHEDRHDESRPVELPAYVAELQAAVDLLDSNPQAAFQKLGQACWDIASAHPKQFRLDPPGVDEEGVPKDVLYLKKIWRRRPD